MLEIKWILCLVLCGAFVVSLLGCQKADQTETADSPDGLFAWLGGESETQRREKLLATLTSSDADLRRQGVKLLADGVSADWDATPRILRMMVMGDQNEYVRAAALEALVQLDQTDVVAELLSKAARDLSPIMRSQCVAAALAVDDQTAVSVLTEMVSNDPDAVVRTEAAAALGQYREHGAITALLEAMGDDEFSVCYTARQSLTQLVGRDLGDDPQAWRTWLFAGEDRLAVPAQ